MPVSRLPRYRLLVEVIDCLFHCVFLSTYGVAGHSARDAAEPKHARVEATCAFDIELAQKSRRSDNGTESGLPEADKRLRDTIVGR